MCCYNSTSGMKREGKMRNCLLRSMLLLGKLPLLLPPLPHFFLTCITTTPTPFGFFLEIAMLVLWALPP